MRLLLLALALPATALASFESPQTGEIALRDMPNTRGSWQEARALVDASPQHVLAWLTDYPRWPVLFRDVESVRVVSRKGDVDTVWMRSRIVGADLTVEIHIASQPGGAAIFYRGEDHRISTSGRIFLTASGPDRTDLIMQTTVRVGGLRGVFAPRELIRSRQRAKLLSDVGDLMRLARRSRPSRPTGSRAETP